MPAIGSKVERKLVCVLDAQGKRCQGGLNVLNAKKEPIKKVTNAGLSGLKKGCAIDVQKILFPQKVAPDALNAFINAKKIIENALKVNSVSGKEVFATLQGLLPKAKKANPPNTSIGPTRILFADLWTTEKVTSGL